MASRWVPLQRNYEKEKAQGVLKRDDADEAHPLLPEKPLVVQTASVPLPSDNPTSKTEKKKDVEPDPLSAMSDPLSMDPLSSAAIDDPLSATPLSRSSSTTSAKGKLTTSASTSSVGSSLKKTDSILNKEEPIDLDAPPEFTSWSLKKNLILQEFTTNEIISVNFLEGTGGGGGGGAEIPGKTRPPTDKAQQRLAQLEQSEEDAMRETLQLTQKDYEKHIERLHEELIKAWENEERVKSLKIAIQCAKLLSDISVIKFYPSKFVLVTEILDTFGRLVYERIAQRSIQTATDSRTGLPKSPDSFIPSEISDQARETCRNWFYKIASIRELLPRLIF